MKKLIMIILSGLLMLACGKQGSVSNKETGGTAPAEKTYKIGITQIVTHPSLDLAKEGFKKALEEAGLKTEFDEKNAEGSMANANLIATNFKSDKKDLVFGIATPSAQALANNISDIPVIFSAVTDPESAKIMKQKVTRTNDKVDKIGEQLDLLFQLKPNAKKIGVLYNTSEQNSLVQVKDIEKIAKEKGIEVVLQGVTAFGELAQATKALLSQVDALYIPTDNLIVSGIKLINSEAIASKKPVIATENSSVELGSLYTMGIDYFELGKRAGQMAVEILKGKPASEIPFEISDKKILYVNEDTAKALGFDIKNPAFAGATIVKTKN